MPTKSSFRVIHASGQDEQYKASELNSHSPVTKGWISSRFCLYPQDIVIHLDERTRLRKLQILSHQFLVATKIEFYVGDVPDGTPVSLQNARYTRLGYVALSDNEKTDFKARELKSVHVDAVGVFVKFVIHKNHINKHNLYNQVGIVAMNVIGDPVHNSGEKYSPNISDERLEADPSLADVFNRAVLKSKIPDYISPLDDLAFDMYQDPEVAQIIRKLEKKKQEAVLQERYDYAKKLKQAIADLQRVGEKLGKYEVEKRQAVENEDYDKAKLKKVQMDEYRLQVYQQLEIHDLLESGGARNLNPIDLEPSNTPIPARLTELPPSQTPAPASPGPPRTPYDERPLPAINKKSRSTPTPEPPLQSFSEQQLKNQNTPRESTPSRQDGMRTPYDERPLPVNKKEAQPVDEEPPPAEEPTSGNVTGEPEAMTEKDQREAGIIIDAFGLPLASKAYSKTWSFREDALLSVYKQMSELPPSTPKDDSKAMMRAAVQLVCKAIKDKVFAVYTAAINLLRMILTEFVPNHKIPRQDVAYAVDKTLPHLLQKTGDTATRNRESAKQLIFDMSTLPEVKPLHIIPVECVKPFKLTILTRLAFSRTELVDQLYMEHGLENSGLTVENVMRFCSQALQHNAGDVREQAEKIIIALYKQVGAPVKQYLPQDTDKTRKNVLYKQLFEAFDKIDGKPSREDVKRQRDQQEAAKKKEIEALQAQVQALRNMAQGKATKDKHGNAKPANKPVDEKMIKEDSPRKDDPPKAKASKDKKNKKNTGKPSQADPADDNISMMDMDKQCIFCEEKNEDFTEEGLDLHYWRSCPMLKQCAHCRQVVEIASLTEHLLTECTAQDKFAKCPRCSEAIPKTEHEQHVAEKACNAAEPNKNHCPLCHSNIPTGEEGWKTHLMSKDGCKLNPRRLTALKNKGKSPASKNRGKPTGAKAGKK